jgi:hypothetical protein
MVPSLGLDHSFTSSLHVGGLAFPSTQLSSLESARHRGWVTTQWLGTCLVCMMLGFMPAPNKYIGWAGTTVKGPLPAMGRNAQDCGEQLPKRDTKAALVTPKGSEQTERPGPVGLIPSSQPQAWTLQAVVTWLTICPCLPRKAFCPGREGTGH